MGTHGSSHFRKACQKVVCTQAAARLMTIKGHGEDCSRQPTNRSIDNSGDAMQKTAERQNNSQTWISNKLSMAAVERSFFLLLSNHQQYYPGTYTYIKLLTLLHIVPPLSPFSARKCRRGNFLFWSPSDILCFFLLFVTLFFTFFPRFFFIFFALSFFQLQVLLAVRFLFCIHKNSFSSFPFLSFFLSFFRYKWRERTRLIGSSNCTVVAAPKPTAIQQHHNKSSSSSSSSSSRKRARARVCVSVARSRHRRSSPSKTWHWGVPTARWTWLLGRCFSWRDTVKAVPALLAMASE